jgi:hypothetical protein
MVRYQERIQRLVEALGVDEVTAWRILRDQAILKRRYAYQDRARVYSKW